MTKRYRCIRCRSRIDIDLFSCPACGEERPLRYLRSRRITAAVILTTAIVAVSTWFALV